MSRGKWTIDKETGKLIDFVEKKIEVNAPRLKIDSMEPLQHPITGEYYDSKSKFRAITKLHGYEEVEVGYRPKPPVNEKYDEELERDITQSYYQIRDGEAPLSEFDKARCKIADNNLKEYNYDNRPRNPDGSLRD